MVTSVRNAVAIRWLTACLDLPGRSFQAGTAFWSSATGWEPSAPRGDRQQFVTLLPGGADPFLRLQRTTSGAAGVHLDLHVDSVPAGVRRAVELGATAPVEGGLGLTSPGGLPFCLVHHDGQSSRPVPVPAGDGAAALIDQVCVDIPAPAHDAETAFWAALTGWDHRSSELAEFSHLRRPDDMPLRLLLQRLGPDKAGQTVRAHLDLACGEGIPAVAADHQRYGAVVVREERYWQVMVAPDGSTYCLTHRDPVTGTS